MPYGQRTKRLQKQFLSLTSLGILVTAIVVAISIALPLYQHDRTHHELNLKATAENRALAIHGYLNMTTQLATQVSNRTFARQKLEQYLNKQIRLSDLRALTLPVFADAMSQDSNIIAITRLDRQGNTLIEAGHTIPEALRPIPGDDLASKHLISPPVKIGTETALLIGSKIFNNQQQRIGTDIIAFNSDALARLQHQRQGLTHSETVYIGTLEKNTIKIISFELDKLKTSSSPTPASATAPGHWQSVLQRQTSMPRCCGNSLLLP